jgi:hypothetical protein
MTLFAFSTRKKAPQNRLTDSLLCGGALLFDLIKTSG